MAPGLGFKGGILAFAEESVWGTSVTRTHFIECISGEIRKEIDPLYSKAIPSRHSYTNEFAKGAEKSEGRFEFEMRYQGMELFLKHALGSVYTDEVASFVVGAGNKYMDFKEDGGGALAATLTEATYQMGERSHYLIDATNNKIDFKEDGGAEVTATLVEAEYATAALLAAQIKTQLEAVGAGTYTIAFSATTNKFTISVAGGATTFQILWKTGTNGADGTDTTPHDLLGFKDTVDGVDGASTTSDYSTYDPDGTLCAEIKTQLETAGTGTYTVTFSNTTKKITIAVAGAIASVQFLWKTGTHGSDNTDDHVGTTIGFDDTADSADQASHTADNTVITVFDHTFAITDDLPTGLTMEFNEDISAGTMPGGKIGSMDMSIDYNNFLICSITCPGKDKTYGTVTIPTLLTTPLVVFTHGAATYGGPAASIKNGKFSINNQLALDRQFVGSSTIGQPLVKAKLDVTGSMQIEFEDTAKFDDFVAATNKAITMTFTHPTAIKSTLYYTVTVTFPTIKLTSAQPSFNGEGPMTIDVPFKAEATQGGANEMTIVVRNVLSLVS